MDKKKRRITRYLAVALTMLVMVVFSAGVVFAEPYIPEKRVLYVDEIIGSYNIYLDGVSKTSAITKLKSSKKSVATVSKFVFGDQAYVGITPKKPGKTTVTFNVKYGKKTIKAKTNVEVRKYANPFKSLKVGSNDYKTNFNNSSYCIVKKTMKGKLAVTLKSGWRISRMEMYNAKDGSGFKIIKNKKTVKVPKGYSLSISVLPKDAPEDEEPLCCVISVE